MNQTIQGGEYYTHLLATGLWNDYPVSASSISGYVVEYRGTLTGPSSSGIVGYESTKNALPISGTSIDPTQIVYGDILTYIITAANSSDVSTAVRIVDKVPDGLEVITSSITSGGIFDPSTREISWETNIPIEATGTVSFQTQKSLLSNNMMVNTAFVTSGGITQQTNSTYHFGGICNVNFVSGTGGSITNGNTQLIDYDQNPYAGITVTPDLGYTFAGWSYPSYQSLKNETIQAGSGISDYTTIIVKGNMSLTANFTLNTYDITYELNGGTATNPATFDVHTATFTLNEPVRSGYLFLGWTGSNGNTPQKNVEIPMGSVGNRTYEANWEIIEYDILYDYDGGTAPSTPNPVHYYVTSATFTLNNPTRDGYTFSGWTGTNGTTPQTTVTISSGSTGDRIYKANWLPINYTITYNFSSGNAPLPANPVNYTIEDTPFSILNEPTRTGYTFTGWTGSNGSTPQKTVTVAAGSFGNLNYTANWSTDAYTITYDYDGGTAPSTANKASYNITDTPFSIDNEPTRNGYTFTGWTGSNGTTPQLSVTISSGTTGNLNYKANWVPLTYSINYILNGGTATNPVSYNITSADFTLATPSRPGYTFTGWTGSNGSTPQLTVTIQTGTIGNLSYEAHWNLDTYHITYDYDGGIASAIANPSSYTIEQTPFTIDNHPSRPGYIFTGWTGSNGLTPQMYVSVASGTTGSLSYKANWSTEGYTITYNFNGGLPPIFPNPSGYDVTQTPFMIVNHPTRPGYTFVGWTGSNGNIPELNVHVPVTSMGNLFYDAKWSFQFAQDTIYSCTSPLKIESGHDGLNYEWVLPDGSSKNGSSIMANCSGDYILYTNYGSMITADTVYVLIFFEETLQIGYNSKDGIKAGSEIHFYAPLNDNVQQVIYQWSIQGATPSTFTGDTATVFFDTSGKKKITVNITATQGSLVCNKTLEIDLNILASQNGFFVNQHVSGSINNGLSWATAYRTLQEALSHAGKNDYIWVAKGDYTPDRNDSYLIYRDSIKIYGGFEGWEMDLSERNFAKNPTFLKGNNNTVIVNANVDGIQWDGFIIEGGNASSGGGVRNIKATAVISNSIIRNNKAGRGGGIYSTQGNPFLYNVEISGNIAVEGGGMYNDLANPELTNITISGNKATEGGGIYNNSAIPDIRNTIIYGNKAEIEPAVLNVFSAPLFRHSLIEGSKGSAGWISSFGIDGNNNLDSNPFFRKDGFDSSDNPVNGNYELLTSSCVIDKGNREHIYNIEICSFMDLSMLTNGQYSSLPYDLNNNERITNDKVDMGAYEYNATPIFPHINRVVRIPFVEGLITDPVAGEHLVPSHYDFVFSIMATPGYSLENLVIKTGVPLRDKEGIKIMENPDGSIIVTIKQVTESLDIIINNVWPVQNDEIDTQRVWSHGNKLYISTDQDSDLRIYHMNGKMFLQQRVKASETIIPLDDGIYTILLGKSTYKVFIKN